MASVDDIEELIATRKLNGIDDGLYKESDKNVANKIKRQVENAIRYYKNIDNIEEVPIDILRAMYKDLLAELEQNKIKLQKSWSNNLELSGQLKEAKARIKKLENKLLDTMHSTKIIKKETPEYIKENYIPVQKVKDKIEELKIKSQQTYEEFLKSNRLDMNLHCRGIYTDAQIVILKELLEENKK